jgi:hypothetical protein
VPALVDTDGDGVVTRVELLKYIIETQLAEAHCLRFSTGNCTRGCRCVSLLCSA